MAQVGDADQVRPVLFSISLLGPSWRDALRGSTASVCPARTFMRYLIFVLRSKGPAAARLTAEKYAPIQDLSDDDSGEQQPDRREGKVPQGAAQVIGKAENAAAALTARVQARTHRVRCR